MNTCSCTIMVTLLFCNLFWFKLVLKGEVTVSIIRYSLEITLFCKLHLCSMLPDLSVAAPQTNAHSID